MAKNVNGAKTAVLPGSWHRAFLRQAGRGVAWCPRKQARCVRGVSASAPVLSASYLTPGRLWSAAWSGRAAWGAFGWSRLAITAAVRAPLSAASGCDLTTDLPAISPLLASLVGARQLGRPVAWRLGSGRMWQCFAGGAALGALGWG